MNDRDDYDDFGNLRSWQPPAPKNYEAPMNQRDKTALERAQESLLEYQRKWGLSDALCGRKYGENNARDPGKVNMDRYDLAYRDGWDLGQAQIKDSMRRLGLLSQ